MRSTRIRRRSTSRSRARRGSWPTGRRSSCGRGRWRASGPSSRGGSGPGGTGSGSSRSAAAPVRSRPVPGLRSVPILRPPGVSLIGMPGDAVMPVDEGAVLAAARVGDEQAFERLLEPHRRALHVHCYRLLGSLCDADDALQETSLRAWRGLDSYEPRAPFRSWLYRIATNVCLRAIERRSRVPEPLDPEEAEIAGFFQPFPDRLLETEVEEHEAVGLAFVSVM